MDSTKTYTPAREITRRVKRELIKRFPSVKFRTRTEHVGFGSTETFVAFMPKDLTTITRESIRALEKEIRTVVEFYEIGKIFYVDDYVEQVPRLEVAESGALVERPTVTYTHVQFQDDL